MNEATIMAAVTFLGGSVLFSLSILVLVAAFIAVNNIIHRYWKPMNLIEFHERRPEYVTPKVDKIEPLVNEKTLYKTTTKETTK